jgi:hypothetical protein
MEPEPQLEPEKGRAQQRDICLSCHMQGLLEVPRDTVHSCTALTKSLELSQHVPVPALPHLFMVLVHLWCARGHAMISG